jgi:molecular chaperone GrpE (heat shock protein)
MDESPSKTVNGEPVDRASEQSDATSNEDDSYRVDDRRHWTRDDPDGAEGRSTPQQPSILDEYRRRAEDAERQLQEYIAAFKRHQDDQNEFRERLNRDVERRVELHFSELLTDLLDVVDDMDLALAHMSDVPAAGPLTRGVSIARDRFLTALSRQGVEPVMPTGERFDPQEAEAIRMDPVGDASHDGCVTAILRPGFRLGSRVIRPARVAVGRFTSPR